MKKIICLIMAIGMALSMVACGNNTTNEIQYDSLNTDKYLEEVASMDEADFLTYIQDYALSAKPTYILYDIVDSKMDTISEANRETVRQTEWVSLVYNIAKYKDLVSIYSEGIVFNDDETFNYEESIANIGDGTFEDIYNDMLACGLVICKRNDNIYVTTDVISFVNRAGEDIGDAFRDYISIVNEIDKYSFLRDGIVNYENIEHCLVFSDNFLKTHKTDKIWETVYQQYYYQTLMYTGLYEIGGFFNEDGSYNPDFEGLLTEAINEHPNTLFAEIMKLTMDDVLAYVAQNSESSFDYDVLQTILDNAFTEVLDPYYFEFLKVNYPEEYEEIMDSIALEESIIENDNSIYYEGDTSENAEDSTDESTDAEGIEGPNN